MTLAVFSLLYLLLTSDRAMLRMRGHNAPDMVVTILHEKLEGVIEGTHMLGYGEFACDVQDGELLVITVRTNGAIIATAVLQISIDLAAQCGDVAIVRAANNVNLSQEHFGVMDVARYSNSFQHEMITEDEIEQSL
jgi:hypothetical protein